MRKLICIIGFFLMALLIQAETIKIGIFQNLSLNAIQLKIHEGSYQLLLEDNSSIKISAGDRIQVESTGSKIRFYFKDKKYESKKIILNTLTKNSRFNLVKSKFNRDYEDNLIIKIRKGKLLLINEINLDKYVAGVVKAEVGNHRPFEYYKVQSIISRTYALSNNHKHNTDGFHLCDQVHCQVYHGKPMDNDSIILAALETSNYVLTDHNIDLITTVFHSNCGGHTINSDKVWSKPLPYLHGVVDTFCLHMPNAQWERSISKSGWIDYLKRKNFHRSLPRDTISTNREQIMEFDPLKFESTKDNLSGHEIRSDWNLKSASFFASATNNEILLLGKGFGHGVGLCQEGAIHMAELGYTSAEIIHFYYNDVHLIDLNHLDFFKE